MALTALDKNLLIASLERSLNAGKQAAGIVAVEMVQTNIDALRNDYNTNPATVTAQQIVDAADTLSKLVFPSITSISPLLTEARNEAAQ